MTKVKFKVVFDNELKVVVETSSIDLPYVEGVRKLQEIWDRNSNTLTLTWEYDNSEATFKIYKRIGDEDGNYYFEEVGTTQDKTYVISNFTLDEYNRIDGIALTLSSTKKRADLLFLTRVGLAQK